MATQKNKVLFGFSDLYIGTYEVDENDVVTLGEPYHQKVQLAIPPRMQQKNPTSMPTMSHTTQLTLRELMKATSLLRCSMTSSRLSSSAM